MCQQLLHHLCKQNRKSQKVTTTNIKNMFFKRSGCKYFPATSGGYKENFNSLVFSQWVSIESSKRLSLARNAGTNQLGRGGGRCKPLPPCRVWGGALASEDFCAI